MRSRRPIAISPIPSARSPQVGNFLFAEGNMNKTEMRTHYALWAIMGAPLILGHDLSDFGSGGEPNRMSAAEFLAIVGNAEVAASSRARRVLSICASKYPSSVHLSPVDCPPAGHQGEPGS